MGTIRRIMAVFLAAWGAASFAFWWDHIQPQPAAVFCGVLFIGLAIVVWPFKRD